MNASVSDFRNSARRQHMNIGAICTRRIVTVDGTASPVEAAGLMRKHHVGALVVTSDTPDGPHVSGILTDRDLVVGALAEGLDGGEVEVRQIATHELVTVFETDDLSTAISAMQESGVRRLLVTDEDERLSGFVSLDDLIEACAKDLAGLNQVIRGGIEREVADMEELPEQAHLRVPSMGTAAWGTSMA
jgi:CBS domain-containing protein